MLRPSMQDSTVLTRWEMKSWLPAHTLRKGVVASWIQHLNGTGIKKT